MLSFASRVQASSSLLRTSRQPLGSLKRGDEPRGADRVPLAKSVGQSVCGYVILDDRPIPERNLRLLVLEHKKSRARHLHIETDDTNNAFTVIFKTQPTDNTGKAHILEHMALCGSQRYPVRDPFFHMTTRSVNTYMNAWTGSDFTQYPFTTQNGKDFDNLLNVYLDAAFFPLLNHMDFLQEGWRLERATDGVPKRRPRLVYKGVVYNEMKGAMSDPNRLFAQRIAAELFPGTPYALNNGGDPQSIPALTYEELKAFHQQHYHPSNAIFFTYGDLPLKQHLRTIGSYIDTFTRGIAQELAPPQHIDAPRRKVFPLPLTPGAAENAQHRVAQAWALPETKDTFLNFSLGVLSALLIDGPNSPLYQALIDSGLGADYSPGTGFDTSSPRGVFSVGLSGVRKENVPRVAKAIRAGLKRAARDGFSAERIEAILHQMEIDIKYVRGNFGIELISGLTSPLIHGGSVVEALHAVGLVDRLRRELGMTAAGDQPNDFFQRLIREHLINNERHVLLVGRPDAKYARREEAAEKRALKQAVLSDAAEQQARELLLRQQETPDVDCLPCLKVPDDINPHNTPTCLDRAPQRTHDGRHDVDVYWARQPTNTLVGFRMINPLPGLEQLPLAAYPYLPFFCFVFTQVGTRACTYAQLSQRIESSTAGISASMHSVHLPGSGDYELGVEFSGLCLQRNQQAMFDLLRELLVDTSNFADHARLDVLLQMFTSALEDKLVSAGHEFAVLRAKAAVSPCHALGDMWSGVSALTFYQSLVARRQRGDAACFDELTAQLQSIARAVCPVSAHSRCLVNAEPAAVDPIRPSLAAFVASLPVSDAPRLGAALPPSLMAGQQQQQQQQQPLREVIEAPITVNFVGSAMAGPASMTPAAVGLALGTRLLSRRYLHNEIREKGGAYGADLSLGGNLLSFYTYRDPDPVNSLRVFDAALDWLEQPSSLPDKDIAEAKLRIFGRLDAPVPPTQRGVRFFKQHVTDEMDEQQRAALLSCDRKQILDAARHYLNPLATRHTAIVCSPEVREQLPTFDTFKFDH